MLCKVGEYSDIFQVPAVRRALGGPGYSKKYQTTLLYEQLIGTRIERIKELTELLNRQALTRDTIADIAKNTSAKAKRNKPTPVAVKDDHLQYELVVFLPTAADLKSISATYPGAETLRRALGLYDNLSEAAVVVIFAPVRHLTSVIEKLLPACGFNGAKYVFLLQAA